VVLDKGEREAIGSLRRGRLRSHRSLRWYRGNKSSPEELAAASAAERETLRARREREVTHAKSHAARREYAPSSHTR
jgi:hypothetical protein